MTNNKINLYAQFISEQILQSDELVIENVEINEENIDLFIGFALEEGCSENDIVEYFEEQQILNELSPEKLKRYVRAVAGNEYNPKSMAYAKLAHRDMEHETGADYPNAPGERRVFRKTMKKRKTGINMALNKLVKSNPQNKGTASYLKKATNPDKKNSAVDVIAHDSGTAGYDHPKDKPGQYTRSDARRQSRETGLEKAVKRLKEELDILENLFK